MTKKITKEMFEEATNRTPEGDDMERVNCQFAGQLGHLCCGWCDEHNGPQYVCGCGHMKYTEQNKLKKVVS